tara:strand:- start:243 stop:1208 length:966 start_codon:yes stop_codon:yes gene_type:complete
MMHNHSICVIGAGPWGLNHIRTLQKIGSLGGVVDSNASILDDIKKKFPNCLTLLSIDESFKYEFDAYVVATPPKSHFLIAKRIIEEKKHILVEKPITLDLNEAKELNKLAKKNNVNLMVGHLLLFHPAFVKIKSIVDQGKIGDIQYIYSNRLNLGSFRNDENVLWSFAPHDISLFNYFFESLPLTVHSRGVDILQDGVHDTSITSFKYDGNRMGHIFVSWLHPFKEHRFVVIGSKGMLHFEDAGKNKKLMFYKKSVDLNGDLPVSKSDGEIEVNFSNELPLESELKYFISNMDGKIEKANGDSAVEVMKILELASKSLSSS